MEPIKKREVVGAPSLGVFNSIQFNVTHVFLANATTQGRSLTREHGTIKFARPFATNHGQSSWVAMKVKPFAFKLMERNKKKRIVFVRATRRSLQERERVCTLDKWNLLRFLPLQQCGLYQRTKKNYGPLSFHCVFPPRMRDKIEILSLLRLVLGLRGIFTSFLGLHFNHGSMEVGYKAIFLRSQWSIPLLFL